MNVLERMRQAFVDPFVRGTCVVRIDNADGVEETVNLTTGDTLLLTVPGPILRGQRALHQKVENAEHLMRRAQDERDHVVDSLREIVRIAEAAEDAWNA